MQVADLFRPPLGVLSVKCPSRANQASGLAGGFDFYYTIKKVLQKTTRQKKSFVECFISAQDF